MTERILCVDDDASFLDTLKRTLHGKFDFEIAVGSEAGLAALARSAFAVVVSDMRMPGMDGTRFLTLVKERWPEAVRIMLTGESDIRATISAVNIGNLFRFLTKPCAPAELIATMEAALGQHRLVVAERELLEKTLAGSVRVLTEILSIVSPRAFERSLRAKRYARHIADHSGLKAGWQVELATMLSQIGCITLPTEVLDRLVANQPMAGKDRELAEGRHLGASNLLAHIPRLEPIARMIELQGVVGVAAPWPVDPCIPGAQMVYIALEVESLIAQGAAPSVAIGALRPRLGPRFHKCFTALDTYDFGAAPQAVRAIATKDLMLGMVLDEDVRTTDGLLLASKGTETTQAVIERLRNYAKLIGIAEPFRVLAPP